MEDQIRKIVREEIHAILETINHCEIRQNDELLKIESELTLFIIDHMLSKTTQKLEL